VLAFFDDEVGAGSGAPLHATAPSATNEERQRAIQETVFMRLHVADCRPTLCRCALSLDPHATGAFMR
jgi:hypothetical protein